MLNSIQVSSYILSNYRLLLFLISDSVPALPTHTDLSFRPSTRTLGSLHRGINAGSLDMRSPRPGKERQNRRAWKHNRPKTTQLAMNIRTSSQSTFSIFVEPQKRVRRAEVMLSQWKQTGSHLRHCGHRGDAWGVRLIWKVPKLAWCCCWI